MQESWRVTNEMLGKLTGEEEGAKKGPTAWIRQLRCEEEVAKRRCLTKQAKSRQADSDADEQLGPPAFFVEVYFFVGLKIYLRQNTITVGTCRYSHLASYI